jgi:hypothetical protein
MVVAVFVAVDEAAIKVVVVADLLQTSGRNDFSAIANALTHEERKKHIEEGVYHEFPARKQMFTRQSLGNPAQQEVVAPAPWPIKMWLVDVDCAFYDLASPT